MRNKPILFSTEMVQAILDGRKTQTRRVIKPQPALMTDKSHFNFNGEYYLTKEQLLQKAKIQKGDLLWVRETWTRGSDSYPYVHKAGYPENIPDHIENVPDINQLTWKPSIHMPKEACRIFLEVTDVRVDRLHDISEADSISEGVTPDKGGVPFKGKTKFFQLWESINGSESLEKNPWVWVYDFKKVEKPAGWPSKISRLKSKV